jgi:polysaccharide pyruvyl transferase WcaK-like protein
VYSERRDNKLKILHVASFIGNIGDNASHIGLKSLLDKFFEAYEIEQMEIRRFYKNYKHSDVQKFDENFINYANTFDLLIIGGGGFLDYWVKGSTTGTTIDLPPELVKKIKVPTLIMSVGCMPHREVPEGNLEKFKAFLQAVSNNPKVAIAVRNDGSINTLKEILTPEELSEIPEILDNGFYYDTGLNNCLPVKDYIAINITLDQIKMNSKSRGVIDIDVYKHEMRSVIKFITEDLGKDVVFVPHIYSDVKAIYEVLEGLDDFLIRTKITIAPYIQGDFGANTLFGIYKNSSLVLATRFHANVCAMSMGVPVIGLAALDRVEYIYKKVSEQNDCVYLKGAFSKFLNHKIQCKCQSNKQSSNSIQMLQKARNTSLVRVQEVLKTLGVNHD